MSDCWRGLLYTKDGHRTTMQQLGWQNTFLESEDYSLDDEDREFLYNINEGIKYIEKINKKVKEVIDKYE